MKGDFYLIYLALSFIIGGAYVLINNKLFFDPSLNIRGGIISIIVGLMLVWLFIKQNKEERNK